MDKKDMQMKGLTVPYINQSTVTECGEEFTLPDYYPEIKRVVSTLCRVLPESWYDNGDSVEQGGVVAFTVLYLGDDGSLTAAPLTTDFSASVPFPRTGDRSESVITADTTAENVVCRCSGPRRISLRARLRTTVFGNISVSTETDVTDTGKDRATAAERISVQTLEDEVTSLRRAVGRLTGSVSGELHEKAGTKPVMCDGEIAVSEAVCSDGMVKVRGEAVFWCICYGEDGLYYKTVAKAPVEEKLSVTGADIADGDAVAWGRCATVSVKETDEGTLSWDMEYDLECEVGNNVSVKITKDMYSTMWMGNTVTDECDSLSLLEFCMGRLSVSGNSTRSGSAAVGEYIIGSYGKTTCERVDRTGTKLTVTGSADIRVLVCGGGEVTEESVRVPVKYECDCPAGDMGDVVWRCDMSVTESSAHIEGNKISVTAEVSVSLAAWIRCPTSYVAKLELDRTAERNCDGVIRVYYPSEGETAWDITKKYGIPKNAVTEVTGSVLIE